MQMWHRLPSVSSMIDHETITVRFQASLPGNLPRFEQQMTQEDLVRRDGFAKARDWLLRDNQEVGGRLRFDVVEGQDEVVFVSNSGRNLSFDDFFEECHAPVKSRNPGA